MAVSCEDNEKDSHVESDEDEEKYELIKRMAWNEVPIGQISRITFENEEWIREIVLELERGWSEGAMPEPTSTVNLYLAGLHEDLNSPRGLAVEPDLENTFPFLVAGAIEVTNKALAERGVDPEDTVHAALGLRAFFGTWENRINKTIPDSEGWEEAA